VDKLKVFICDDSATVRERLVTMTLDLPEMDLVGQADDAPGCLDAIRQARPDIVILDIRMPGGNGIDVLRQLKASPPSPKVIMLTNFAYVQYQKSCEDAGADYFLDKSTEFDQIPLVLAREFHDMREVQAQTLATLMPERQPELV
jgi:DNA-binding NarL/FixJ family response regulator